MQINFDGIIIGALTFLIIGLFHPIVIKAEYHWGVKCWWAFLIVGLALLAASLFIEHHILSIAIAVVGITSLWSILEIFEQRERVRKGWFPDNPNRKR